MGWAVCDGDHSSFVMKDSEAGTTLSHAGHAVLTVLRRRVAESGISMKVMVQQKARTQRGKHSDIGGPPTNLDFEKALMFFHAYMYGPLQGKLRLYRARDVRSAGKALTSDWEVFASF